MQQAKYAIVREHLRKRIASMTPGDQIPSETTLCDEYDVSRITIRRSVEDLLREGLLTKEQGRGTFVTVPRFVQEARESFSEDVTGFYRQQQALGRVVSTTVLGNRRTRNGVAAKMLGLLPTDELIFLERLRYVGHSLHQHVTTYLSAEAFPDVLTTDFSQGSLFDHLEKQYDVKLSRNELVIRIERVKGQLAADLGVEPNDAVMALDSTVYDQHDRAVAFGVAHLTPDHSEVAFSVNTDGR
jgi:Transcriptional regulators